MNKILIENMLTKAALVVEDFVNAEVHFKPFKGFWIDLNDGSGRELFFFRAHQAFDFIAESVRQGRVAEELGM
jgi:hypothetical protein